MTFCDIHLRYFSATLRFVFALSLIYAGIGKAAQLGASASLHPSFSCSKPSALEKVICDDPGLSDADRRMAALYAAARRGALGDGGSQIDHSQKT
jgi:uncharacterized protein